MKFAIFTVLICIAGCVPVDPNAGQAIDECQSNAECNDGIFCNGDELCLSGLCIASTITCVDDDFERLVARCNIDFGGSSNSNELATIISDLVGGLDEIWQFGVSFSDATELMRNSCTNSTFGCTCMDRMIRYVWFTLHSATLNDPPIVSDDEPPFVSGNVFSFLSVPETDLFNLMVAGANNEITQWRIDELRRISSELARRGLSSGGAQGRQLACDTDIEAARRRREATWQVLDEHLGFSMGVLFSIGVTDEVEEWNCRQYPDPTCAVISFCH